VTPSGHALHLSASDFGEPVMPIGSVALPGNYSPHRTEYRKEVGRRVRRAKLRKPQRTGGVAEDHPVAADPDLADRLAAAASADRVRREIEQLENRTERRTASLAREFDAVLEILVERGYVDVDRWRLTSTGERLSNLFHESDLLIAEVIAAGLLDGLDAPTMAGMVSGFVYEHRSPDEPPRPWFPDAEIRRRWREVEAISDRLAHDERRRGLAEHRPPDPGFFATAYAWCAGETFADLVAEEDLTGGDFVRTSKQVVDLLGQVAGVTSGSVADAARRAAAATRRGVVADSSVVAR
jgi:ATP-dependent RNA helicase HelY